MAIADVPNDSDEDASFLVGPLALVSISNSMLTINPIAAGDFKIAVDPNYNTATDEDDATTDAILCPSSLRSCRSIRLR